MSAWTPRPARCRSARSARGQLVCKLAADERAAFQDEIDGCEARVKALDDRVVKLENSLAAQARELAADRGGVREDA